MTNQQGLLFAIFEVILLVGFYLAYTRIKGLHHRQRRPSPEEGMPELTLDSYAQLLQAQILSVESRLKQFGESEPKDQSLAAAIETRLKFLKCERKVADSCGADKQELWTLIGEEYAGWVTDEAGSVDGDTESSASPAMMAALQQKLDACRQRVINLEQFRDNFFDVKLRLEAGQAIRQRLHDELDRSVSREDQSPVLLSAMDELKSENETLFKQLQHIQHEFSEIAQDLGEQESALPPGTGASPLANLQQIKSDFIGSFENLDEGVEQIRQVIVVQEQRIQELYTLVDSLQMEVVDKQRLEVCIDNLSNQNSELADVVATIKEENTFLQEQISALLTQELLKDDESRAELSLHKQQLEEITAASAALEKKYADMEQKYLDLYSEYQNSKG